MDHAGMLLRRADVAGVLECDPRVPCFEQHGEHLAPQVCRRHRAAWRQFSTRHFGFVGDVGFFKFSAEFVVQIRHIVR